MKKTLITILATVLVCCCVVGGTLAWLVDSTKTVTNTFTVGNVDIELKETDAEGNILNATETAQNASFKMVPGNTIAKNPTVTVKGGSERCWLFVEITTSTNFADFMEYAIADGWDLVSGETNVWCRDVTANNDDQSFGVLANNQVTVLDSVEKSAMDSLTDATLPTLAVTAYAVQYDADSLNTSALAWAEVSNN